MDLHQAPNGAARAETLAAIVGGATSLGADEALRDAVHAVARSCGPHSIDALVALLRRLNMAAPRRVAARPVVAFIRYGHVDGGASARGVAVTSDGGRYNVHTVFWDELASRWEGSNGRYGMEWDAARVEMNRRADTEPQP
ncbi:hypothetical protein [Virgisporangium ochraceum]|uniref:hypothetical protein n=1 Tax=Virgisporangium ochraceum TaxID=65505 RepID=UPI00194075B6|nr:hypothetical protein [Virgisporangium ochraceum]